jgi:SAM-dependent methyltransferase
MVSTSPDKQSLFVDHSSVSSYYSETLKSSSDLKTNACCSAPPPSDIQSLIKNISPEVVKKYYGCGLCIPDELEGLTILDLGCGAGRDVYIASQLVGAEGRVIGVDMTKEQLDVAIGAKEYHEEKFGFGNVEFHRGFLEKLEDIEALEDNSVDVIISNCVINLCMDKEAVLKNCYRLLKPGGELYFSDVYSNRRVPENLRQDEVLWGECLSGALYWNDFANLAKASGFKDPRLVEDSRITIQNDAVLEKTKAEGCEFYSATYRLFKIDELEPACEDYGQAVIYKGTIPKNEGGWALDDHHYMETGKIFPVCGNTWRMLKDTRFEQHFDFVGNWDKHYGIFEGCGMALPYKSSNGGDISTAGGGKGGGSCC